MSIVHRVGLLAAFMVSLVGCRSDAPVAPSDTALPPLQPSVVYSEVVLLDQDFEAVHLGAEPYPLIAETWCPNSFVGASGDVARSGSRSFRYFHGCPPGANATGTSLSFAMCTRWPTRASMQFSRYHPALGPTAWIVHSASQHEAPSGIVFGADGVIYLLDNSGNPAPVLGSYASGTWTTVETEWDFVEGQFTVTINGSLVGTFPTTVRKAYWVGVFAHTSGMTFYDDDVRVALELKGERQNCDGTEPLPWDWPPPEGRQGG